ncbi:MAG: grasp-with-spasm system SPASM domain peptide maturase [Prevotellaceae bacterium]|jgi:SPASM domain peptide maturase of grasp-with-spasm system|nr:grasp-with-spasm system SPASM domain peptide maturase [Prevotellaceae bacterium]
MENIDKHLIFLPVCIIVKGYERSVILDIQRAILDFVPNDVYDMFQKYNKHKIGDILLNYNNEEQKIVMEYIDFLTQNEYAILGTKHDVEHISDMSLNYNFCGKITNCICEYSEFTQKHICRILSIIDAKLACSAMQIVCDKQITIKELSMFLENFKDITYLNHLEIILPYSPEYFDKNLEKLLWNNLIINRLIFYSAPFDDVKDLRHTFVVYLRENLKNKRCGIVDKSYFAQNIFHITEALHHNTCLNKKLFIDKNGNIKNCPFSETVFGNILNDDSDKIITTLPFTKYWNIRKDEIEVCKDCEFRYICTDCRVFIKDSNNIYSQPANCHYNPYIAKWKGEEGYITVEEWLYKTNQHL